MTTRLSSSRLQTVEDHHAPVHDDADPDAPSTWIPATYTQVGPLPTARASERVAAYVNHGRWIAECPTCRSAQLTSPGDPRFWCCECGWPQGWATVAFPKNRDDLEQVLTDRPIENRNWTTETVAELRAENEANQLGIIRLADWVELPSGQRVYQLTEAGREFVKTPAGRGTALSKLRELA